MSKRQLIDAFVDIATRLFSDNELNIIANVLQRNNAPSAGSVRGPGNGPINSDMRNDRRNDDRQDRPDGGFRGRGGIRSDRGGRGGRGGGFQDARNDNQDFRDARVFAPARGGRGGGRGSSERPGRNDFSRNDAMPRSDRPDQAPRGRGGPMNGGRGGPMNGGRGGADKPTGNDERPPRRPRNNRRPETA